MSEKISLKEAELKAFQSSFADGLWDVMLGCVFLMMAVAPLLSERLGDFWSSFVFLPFWGLVYLSIWLTRKYVVAPRMGRVSYGKTRVKKLRRFTVVMLIINSVLIVLGLIVAFSYSRGVDSKAAEISGMVINGALGLLVLLGFSLAGAWLDFPRLFVYGLMIFILVPVGEWLYQNYGASHHGYPISFGISSAVMIITGLVIFVRFLKDNPVQPVPAEGV